MGEQEKDSGFTDSQRLALEAITKEREHRRWFFDLLKRWATVSAAVILGFGVVWDALARLIRALLEHVKS